MAAKRGSSPAGTDAAFEEQFIQSAFRVATHSVPNRTPVCQKVTRHEMLRLAIVTGWMIVQKNATVTRNHKFWISDRGDNPAQRLHD